MINSDVFCQKGKLVMLVIDIRNLIRVKCYNSNSKTDVTINQVYYGITIL